MSVSMIRNKLGDKSYINYWPCDADAAQGLCDVALQGTWQVFEKIGESGSDNVTDGYFDVFAVIQSEETEDKAYFGFAIPLNKNEGDVFNALKGKTINGVKADKVYVRLTKRVIASNDNS